MTRIRAYTPKDRPLLPREERFVQEYIVDLDATAAAKRAGYAPKCAYSTASKLVKRAPVAAAIAKAKAERAERTKIDSDWVLRKTVEIFERVAQEITPALHPITRRQLKTEDGHPLFTFNSASALRALELVGKHVEVGAFADRLEVTGELSLIERIQAGRRQANLKRKAEEETATPAETVNPRAEQLARAKARTR